MKKKIIKSYFFKTYKSFTNYNNVFCFSKRGVKVRKQLISHLSNNLSSMPFNPATTLYKAYLLNYIIYPKIFLLKTSVFDHFKTSYFKKLNTNVGHPYTKLRQIFYWHKLKRITNLNMIKNIPKYVNTGFLSSHFVHFLLTKNLSYQTRSKYKTDVKNMGLNYYYLYIYTKFLISYTHTLYSDLYFFTANIAQQTRDVDTEFNTTISNWFTTSKAKQSLYVTNVNPINYNYTDLTWLCNNTSLINLYLSEVDSQKKEALYNKLSINNPTLTPILYTSKLFSNHSHPFRNHVELLLLKRLYEVF